MELLQHATSPSLRPTATITPTECFVGDVRVESPEELAAYDPVLNELIGRVFETHRIAMDVFHGRRIRPVTCPAR